MAQMNSYEYEQVHDQAFLNIIHVAAVVQVTAFDSDGMTVDVQPLAKSLEGNSYESQPQILGVPVAMTRSGGFVFRPWINVGDVGVVVYPDHDIDNSIQAGKEMEPLTQRSHSPSDAVFVGGIISGDFTAPGEIPGESAVLFREDGRLYAAVTPEEIALINEETTVVVKSDSVNIHGDVNIEGNITLKGNRKIQGEANVTGNVVMKGNLGVTGNMSATGDMKLGGSAEVTGKVQAKGDVIALEEKSLGTHTHTAPDGETSPPN